VRRAIAMVLIASTLTGCMGWRDTRIPPTAAKEHLRVRTLRSSWIDLFDVHVADDSLHGQIHRRIRGGPDKGWYFKTIASDTTIALADVTAVQDRQSDDVKTGMLLVVLGLAAAMLVTADYSGSFGGR